LEEFAELRRGDRHDSGLSPLGGWEISWRLYSGGGATG